MEQPEESEQPEEVEPCIQNEEVYNVLRNGITTINV